MGIQLKSVNGGPRAGGRGIQESAKNNTKYIHMQIYINLPYIQRSLKKILFTTLKYATICTPPVNGLRQ